MNFIWVLSAGRHGQTYRKSASYPNGGKNTLAVDAQGLGPGVHFVLINSFHSQGPVGDFEDEL